MAFTWEVDMGLTAARVKALLAKPPDKIIAVADGHVDGLAVRIMPSGYASWTVEYTRPVGGRARYTIGPVFEIGLAEARAQALDIRARAAGVKTRTSTSAPPGSRPSGRSGRPPRAPWRSWPSSGSPHARPDRGAGRRGPRSRVCSAVTSSRPSGRSGPRT